MATETKAARRYNATIERTLTLFDPNSDWADYIAFLSRLVKALETGKPDEITDLPSKAKIALSLSRCLQPHLPAGVHQKALGVYHEIFSIIGSEMLARDLSVYLPGLSHALAFANLSTRPLVLGLYTGHLLKLSALALRPALKAIILSLLPVLEEETADDFENYLSTFVSLRTKFANDSQEYFFWQTLFAASISNQTRRAGALVFLNRFLPKLFVSDSLALPASTSFDSAVITSPEPGLLVRCFATGLQDEQALVQRGFLDLLVSHLPLGAAVLQLSEHSRDLDVLVSAALTVVLRRDMSLNRRLWSWFTGGDIQTVAQDAVSPLAERATYPSRNDYFVQYGCSSVGRAIQTMINSPALTPVSLSRPFRILLSLMDRGDVGGPVVLANFSSAMQQLNVYRSTAPSQDAFDEVFRSANVFFDAVESATIFACISELIQNGEAELAYFILENFNFDQADPSRISVLNLGLIVTATMSKHIQRETILARLLNRLIVVLSPNDNTTDKQYQSCLLQLLDSIFAVLNTMLQVRGSLEALPAMCHCLDRAVQLVSVIPTSQIKHLVECVQVALEASTDLESHAFVMIDVSCKMIQSMLQAYITREIAAPRTVLDLLPILICQTWRLLGTQTPQYHVAAVENIWKLQDLATEEEIVESSILALLHRNGHRSGNTKLHQDNVDKFAFFFQHSRTVRRASDDFVPPTLRKACLRIIDECTDLERHEPGVQWLVSLHNLSPIFKLILGEDIQSLQLQALALSRVRKLIIVLSLSEEQWRSFSSSTDIENICHFCIDILKRSTVDGQKGTVNDVFSLLRRLYGSKSGNVAPDQLIELLVDHLEVEAKLITYSEQVLDTLLDILNERTMLPDRLVTVLMQGFADIPNDQRLDKWTALLCNYLPNHASLLPNLLKVTNEFCNRIEQIFGMLQAVFADEPGPKLVDSPERTLANLLSGLEYVLARAHSVAFSDQAQGKSHAGGTFSEPISARARANDRLTVTLCMQDAVKICARLWTWRSNVHSVTAGDPKSFQYAATKLRARSRKILENLVDAEPQECLETIVGMWITNEQTGMLDLLQSLHGARPKAMLPTFFNAINSRNATTTSNADVRNKSTLSVQLDSSQLVSSLEDYTIALEDDMVEEIWSDCMSFFKDVLSNPMQYRHVLIRLMHFCSILAHKMQNTNISEEMRSLRELSDVFARFITAIFAIKPPGFELAVPRGSTAERSENSKTMQQQNLSSTENFLTVLEDALPNMEALLAQYDRSSTVFTTISSQVISPTIHSRSFPQNVTVELLKIMLVVPQSTKSWKKDISDALNSPRFFESSVDLMHAGWKPLFRQLLKSDKGIIAETLNRLAPPATAGIMLGIGANAARAEADRRTLLELRRVGTLILSTEIDGAVGQLPLVTQKIEELFGATTESSPSLASRGEVYMLIRTLLLRFSHSSLGRLWPLVNYELRQLCEDIPSSDNSKYSASSKVQGAKLLELLLLLRPDEFQLHEWLFVTDNIDAIYPNSAARSDSYADKISATLPTTQSHPDGQITENKTLLRPWLAGRNPSDEENANDLVAQFFGHLSIKVFEDLYSLQKVDITACEQDLMTDIFSETPP